jgi:transcriptional regulator with XRE-family HTH domain
MQKIVDGIRYPAYVVLADPQLTIKAWNGLIAQALRWALEEAIDQPAIERLRPVIAPRFRAIREKTMRRRDWWNGAAVLLDRDDDPVAFDSGVCYPVFNRDAIKHYLTVLHPAPPPIPRTRRPVLRDYGVISVPRERISSANSDQGSSALVEIRQSGSSTFRRDGATVPPLDDFVEQALTMIAKTDPERAADLRDQWTKEARREPAQRLRERFSERLRELLAYRRLSNGQVAELMGLGENGHKTISRYRHADHDSGRMAHGADLVALAKALGVSTGYFIDDDPHELTALREGTLPELAALPEGEL